MVATNEKSMPRSEAARRRGYRIAESYPQGGSGVPAGTTNYIYYDANWQAIETRTNGTAASNVTSQMVWSAAYINAAVLQDSYSGGVIQPNSRLYFTQDANWDTTAVIGYDSTTQTWGVVQRYVYSPYGTITVLNADWSTPPTGTQPLVNNLYQGMTLDAVTGLYYERFRNYSPTLGRWTSQDPLKYINGANTYQFVDSSPVGNVDAEGLGSALAQYIYWRSRTQTLVNDFPHFQGNDLTLLKGIAAASILKELQAERHFADGHGGLDPLQYLGRLAAQLEKAKHSLACHPPGDPVIRKIDKAVNAVRQAISDIRDGVALNSGNGPHQIAALGNLISQAAGYLPPGVSQVVKFYAKAMTSAANAVGRLDQTVGQQAWLELTGQYGGPPYIKTSGNSDTPFTPSWAQHVLNQFGDVVPGFPAALRDFIGGLNHQ